MLHHGNDPLDVNSIVSHELDKRLEWFGTML